MSRQKIRDERRERQRERAQPRWRGEGGEASSDDLEVESEAGGREPPASSQDGPREAPPQEAHAQLVAERAAAPSAAPRQEPREVARIEPPAETVAEQREARGERSWEEPLREAPAAPADEHVEESRQQAAIATARRWLEDGLVTAAQARAIGGLIGDGEPGPDVLDGLVEAGILVRSQALAVRRSQASNALALVPVAGGRPARSVPEAGQSQLGVRLPRLSLDARRLGVFLAAIAFVGLVWAMTSLLTDAFGTPRHGAGAILLDLLRLLAGVLALVGGRRMYRGMQNGKPLALIGVVLYALASVLLALRRLGDPVVIGLLLSWAVLYYLTAMSRFRPAESSLAAAGPQ